MENGKVNETIEIAEKRGGAVKKVFRIVGDVLLCAVVAFALFVLIVSVAAKKDSDGTATVFGKQWRFVQSDSMAECDLTDVSAYEIKSIPVKSCVFVEVVPETEEEKAEWYKNLKVGDVLTVKYVYTKQETITHRVVSIEANAAGGYLITLEGDNKNSDTKLLQQTIDTSIADSPNYVVGKVTGQSYALGLLVYAYKTPAGIVCLIIVPCLIIIAFEILRIVRVLGKDKKEKIKAEQAQQASEIEELKRQLAALQAGVPQNSAPRNDVLPPTESGSPESEPTESGSTATAQTSENDRLSGGKEL